MHSKVTGPLTAEQVAAFERDGFVKVRGFYDVGEIEPIQRAVYDIIGLVIERHGLGIRRAPYDPTCFDAGFNELITVDRRFGSEVYDAVKMIPAIVRLAASEKNEAVMRQLRPGSLPGFISRGYGIRIDIPGEDSYRAAWHQEYLYQLRSRDGLTLWSPLLNMTPDLGPVILAAASHRDGLHRVREFAGNRPGAYSWELERESEIIHRYQHFAPLTEPGDVVLLDFLVLHCSGLNRAKRPRWSMQMRLFNFLEPSGVELGWKGSVADGVQVRELLPQFVLPAPASA
jgi:hypothetical protein